jgi:transposase
MRTVGSAKELEVRRRIAGNLLLQGKCVAEVARLVGASWSAVKRWKVAIDKGGIEAVAAKPHPGRRPGLSSAQKRRLIGYLQRGAMLSGFDTNLWTCPRVARVIEKRFGISYDPSHVWRILVGLQWSCQMPEQRARERDEKAIRRWREVDWPRIKKGAPQES